MSACINGELIYIYLMYDIFGLCESDFSNYFCKFSYIYIYYLKYKIYICKFIYILSV